MNSSHILVKSIVDIVYLHLEKMLPTSVIASIGDTVGLTPPSLSDSARLKQIRSSYRESPPIIAPMKAPSGTNVSLKLLRRCSMLLTQWSDMQ